MTTIEFDKKCVCGPEFVCVRLIDNGENLKVGDIYLPQNSEVNERLAFGKIEDVGAKAAEEYGLAVGDYVMFDRLSTFSHTAPICLMKYNNVICKASADKKEYFPVRNMLFVEPEKKDDVQKVNGVYIPGAVDVLNVGTITKMACDEDKKLPFKVGDKVMLTKGADLMQCGETMLHIYKHDMVICTVED